MITLQPPSCSVALGGEFTVMINSQNEVFSFGSNSHGQLGIGDPNSVESVETPVKIESLKGKKIQKVACGYAYTMFLTKKNRVFACGRNENGQLGIGSTNNAFSPTRVEGMKKVIDASCGECHTVFLRKDGKVFSCGYNGHGELGLNSLESKTVPTLIEFPFQVKIVQIQCGEYHTMFLTEKGKVFGCGSNKHGRLGINSPKISQINSPKMIKIPDDERVVQFALGSGNSYFLTEKLKVYSVGYNSRHQLGFDDTVDRYELTPIEFPNGDKILRIEAGHFSYNGFFITTDYKMYTCGFNRYGQLGVGNKNEKMPMKQIVFPSKENVVQIISSGHHTAFVTEKKKIYVSGKNSAGQLGKGDYIERTTPKKLFLPNGKAFIVFSREKHPLRVERYRDDSLRESERIRGITQYIYKDCNLGECVFKIYFKSEESIESIHKGEQEGEIILENVKTTEKEKMLKKEIQNFLAIQSEFFQKLINEKGKSSLVLPKKFYDAVSLVFEWLNGIEVNIKDVYLLKDVYTLSKKFILPHLTYFCVVGLKNKFCNDIEQIIDLLFLLREESINEEYKNSLFDQCLLLFKMNFQKIMEEYPEYLFKKKTKKTSDLYFSLMSIYFKPLKSIESHDDFALLDKEFILKKYHEKHLSNLWERNYMRFTANLVFRTTDLKYVKCHKEILVMNSDYFKSLIAGGFSEGKKNVINLSLDSDTLVPILKFLYTKKIELSVLDFHQLSIILTCSKKFMITKLTKVCTEEMKRRLTYNSFNEDEIMNTMFKMADLKLENMQLKSELNILREKIALKE